MTIAGLYLSPEGVVLGADSTSSTISGGSNYHYFDFGQKLFEVGEGGTLALITWGLGGVGNVSYRFLVACLSDSLQTSPASSVADVAARWVALFWPYYLAMSEVQQAQTLAAKPAHDPDVADSRTPDEEALLQALNRATAVGFCIAGYVPPSRVADAQVVTFWGGEPTPTPVQAPQYRIQCWGMQNVFNRLYYGVDDSSVEAVMASGKWNGTLDDLVQALTANPMQPRAHLPIRDAIDYVHSVIYCTIKGMKFSTHPQVCGGPIELAVITVDRRFRWVRHKSLDAAIADGEPQ